MKFLSKLLAVAGIIATAVLVDRAWRKRSELAPATEPPFPEIPEDEILEAELVMGIADVDPGPLAQTAGEGIDIDAVEGAHREVADQRARLPIPGKNLP